jgi:hypothetical protein
MEPNEQTTSGIDQFVLNARPTYSGEEETVAEQEEVQDPAKKATAEPEHPERKLGEEETVVKPSEETTPDMPEEKENNFRFDSHQAAEEGYRNLRSSATRTEQENARLRRELDQFKNAGKLRQEAEEREKAYLDFSSERHEKALTAIDAIDPDDPEHSKKVARIWAETNRDIRRYEEEHAPAPVRQEEERPPERREETAADDPVSYVRGYLANKGLPDDDRLFWSLAGQAPQERDGKPLDFDQQIDWAIAEAEKTRSAIRDEYKRELESKANKAGHRAAEEEIPLGRGGGRPAVPKPEEAKPVSLSDAVDRALESRRL